MKKLFTPSSMSVFRSWFKSFYFNCRLHLPTASQWTSDGKPVSQRPTVTLNFYRNRSIIKNTKPWDMLLGGSLNQPRDLNSSHGWRATSLEEVLSILNILLLLTTFLTRIPTLSRAEVGLSSKIKLIISSRERQHVLNLQKRLKS